MTIAELNTLYSTASTAMASADWASAITALMQCQARLATMPNMSRDVGSGSQSIQFSPGDIPGLISLCRNNQSAAQAVSLGPFQECKVAYARPS
jgi:hypothetical protein